MVLRSKLRSSGLHGKCFCWLSHLCSSLTILENWLLSQGDGLVSKSAGLGSSELMWKAVVVVAPIPVIPVGKITGRGGTLSQSLQASQPGLRKVKEVGRQGLMPEGRLLTSKPRLCHVSTSTPCPGDFWATVCCVTACAPHGGWQDPVE